MTHVRPPQDIFISSLIEASSSVAESSHLSAGAPHGDVANDARRTRYRSARRFAGSCHRCMDCQVPDFGNLRSGRTARNSLSSITCCASAGVTEAAVTRAAAPINANFISGLLVDLPDRMSRKWGRASVLPTGFLIKVF